MNDGHIITQAQWELFHRMLGFVGSDRCLKTLRASLCSEDAPCVVCAAKAESDRFERQYDKKARVP